ncbi:hypothetical protein [Thiocystis violacea]|uniref:hypothetical protein n=1 Tax=Thiocystis violacea TaxID=13725 RepID=UPI001902D8D2|nr:hypothetical protein [Thiocystis violacea]MBK1723684.1 hypothetical protein [Thiocystis violacea]
MPAGYLVIETRADRAGVVRILASDSPPEPLPRPADTPDTPEVRFVVRFGNLHVARMHAHTALRRHTLDAEAGLYRVDLVTAVAAIDAIDLRHERIYLDAAIAGEPMLATETDRRRRRHRRIDQFFNAVGIAAILYLLLLAIFLI